VQDQSGSRILLSWSVIVRYAIISAINLAILLVGIAIGVMVAPHIEKTVNASPPVPQAANQASPAESHPTSTTANASHQRITPIQPGISIGSVGSYLVLAHRLQSDEAVVNGFNIMKLHEAELGLLSRFVPASEINKVVENAKADELYQVGNPPQPETPTTKPK
jgi:hypothetical protein